MTPSAEKAMRKTCSCRLFAPAQLRICYIRRL